jgi:hypothetical protein
MAKKTAWKATPGQLASYVGRSSRLLRGGRTLRVLAEARGKRMLVEAIGHAGMPVIFTVKAMNLGQPQPDFFDTP